MGFLACGTAYRAIFSDELIGIRFTFDGGSDIFLRYWCSYGFAFRFRRNYRFRIP